MTYGAIDLHKKESQVRIVTEEGGVIDRRIATRRDAFTRLFGSGPRMRLLVEASTESEWVACHLESLGHEVIVADPNYAAMYGGRSRRIKTDLRDVAALTTACVQGTYRPIHRRSLGDKAGPIHPTAICGDLGGVMRAGLIRFHGSPRPPTSACDPMKVQTFFDRPVSPYAASFAGHRGMLVGLL